MTPDEFTQYRAPMFSDRDSLEEALEYAYSMNDPAVTTAVHVVLNTAIALLQPAAAPLKDEVLEAYAVGYYHGRAEGCARCPEGFNDAEQALYRRGYDAGVTAYCQEAHPDEWARPVVDLGE